MLKSGSVLYGLFQLKNEVKEKYAIILHYDNGNFIVTTFTTSQKRSSVLDPVHGANPKGNPRSYVFKANVPVGIKPDGAVFSFPLDTTVVPDYGTVLSSIDDFQKKVSNLEKVCDLYKKEYEDLIYTLYKCEDIDEELLPIFENILSRICE